MMVLDFFIAAVGIMLPYGVLIFIIDWVYCKVIYAFTGRGV